METGVELPTKAAHVVRFEPKAEMSVVHHMLLYLCTGGAAVSYAPSRREKVLLHCLWPYAADSQ